MLDTIYANVYEDSPSILEIPADKHRIAQRERDRDW